MERWGGMVAVSGRMRSAFGALRLAAQKPTPLLILGETGTGKELAARALHALSPRPDAPFVVLDCHRPESATRLLDASRGPMVFLDDICALPMNLQAQLVSELGARGDSARAVFSTQHPIEGLVERGLLLEALAQHLEERCVEIPPLRLRPEDLPSLLEDLSRQTGVARAWSRHELSQLAQHPWPGNVRELRNVLLRAVVGTEPLLEIPAPRPNPSVSDLFYARARSQAVARFEKAYLQELLSEVGFDPTRAQTRSGLSNASLYRLLKKYELRITRLKKSFYFDKGAPSLEEEQ